MSSTSNPEVSPQTAADRRAARLAEIKRLAAAAASAPATGAINEEELYDAAARGMVARRAERGDFVGALIWEKIAHHEEGTRSSRVDVGSPEPGDDQIVPAHRAFSERRDDM